MIFYICAIIGILIGFIVNISEWGFSGESFFTGFVGGFAGLVAALILWLGIGCIVPSCDPIVINSTPTEIHALVDNARYSDTVSGSVFLIQHRNEENLKYSYMYYAEDKGYGFDEVDASKCYINYTDEAPHVVRNHMNYRGAIWRWLFPDIYEDEYIFFIPENAEVINDFAIDFE